MKNELIDEDSEFVESNNLQNWSNVRFGSSSAASPIASAINFFLYYYLHINVEPKFIYNALKSLFLYCAISVSCTHCHEGINCVTGLPKSSVTSSWLSNPFSFSKLAIALNTAKSIVSIFLEIKNSLSWFRS